MGVVGLLSFKGLYFSSHIMTLKDCVSLRNYSSLTFDLRERQAFIFHILRFSVYGLVSGLDYAVTWLSILRRTCMQKII